MLVSPRRLLALATVVCAGCGHATNDPPPDGSGAVVVGVRSDLRAGVDVDRLRVSMTAGGQAYRDDVLTPSSPNRLRFPLELPFEGLSDGTDVAVLLEASLSAIPMPLVTRLASTRVERGRRLLLPVSLERSCVLAAPGGMGGPQCAAPETCVHGKCVSSAVDPSALADYTPGWAATSDVCKPAGGGPPVVIVGQGQSDYLALADGAVTQVEAGPQGGHHVWVAVRMKNLRQAGSVTSVTGHFPELARDVGPFNVIFTFDQDEGGYCKLFGLRFQLDQAVSIDELLGHKLEITVSVQDQDGSVGSGTKLVQLSPTSL